VDFCRRAHEAGWDTYFTPDAEVIHEKGASFNQVLSPQKQAWFNRSLLRYFRQHESLLSYLILLNLYPVSMLLALIANLLHKSIKKKKEL
ncbi:MAG: hypothetical protein ABII72_05115, partial [Parcubacteria group bacterium]